MDKVGWPTLPQGWNLLQFLSSEMVSQPFHNNGIGVMGYLVEGSTKPSSINLFAYWGSWGRICGPFIKHIFFLNGYLREICANSSSTMISGCSWFKNRGQPMKFSQ
jgi:hypothetical protein